MTDNHQLIPFPIPDYLAQFLAHKLNTKIRNHDGLPCIKVERYTLLGKISNHSGDHDSSIPNGKRYFLKLNPTASNDLAIALKSEFEEALLMFVKGAEYAHKKNGWNPMQKRKGIRKHAILEFCKTNEVNLEKRTLDSLFKMVQRHIKLPKPQQTQGLQRFAELLSY